MTSEKHTNKNNNNNIYVPKTARARGQKECSFYTNLFRCTEMRWMFTSSTAIFSNGSDTSSVASKGKSQLTRSKCEWTRIWSI